MKRTFGLLGISLILVLIIFGGIVWHENKKSNRLPRTTQTSDLISTKAIATFAGGCFWCSEADFEKTPGVIEAVSGYTSGFVPNPTYKNVSSGTTGHREAVQVFYDPAQVTYERLLDVFWKHIDPTDDGGQFVDRGQQYTTAIFFHSPEQEAAALASKTTLEASQKFDAPIITPILPATDFYIAEDYHQDYYKKNPTRYSYYRSASGRDAFIEATWKTDLRSTLTPLQYAVTQEGATEEPFNNEYWENKKEGLYVDVIDGTPLFSSMDKYDSGTGWPSFVKPFAEQNITLHEDTTFFIKRVEVRSARSDAHLGHIFPDGPKNNGGVRWCINSAALRFIPKEELPEKYPQFASLFETEKKP